jgi:hypothetical protein
MGEKKGTRKLTVTETKVITSGKSDKGDWTLYDISAVGEDGQPVQKKLRSFQTLPIGELKEYEVEEVNHEKYGQSFTLSLPGSKKGGGSGSRLGPQVDELRDRVENLEQNITWLDGRVAALEGRAPATSRVESPASTGPPAGAPPAAPAAPAAADDDIPF